MNGENENRKATVMFDNDIKIGGKKVPIAEYKGDGASEKVFFIPAGGTLRIRRNEPYLVFLPRDRQPFHINEKTIYSVRIIWPEIAEGTKVFKNIFIPDAEFKKLSNDKIVVIIIDPKGRHNTYFLRIIANSNSREIIWRFVKHNLLIENMWIKENGIIEVLVKPLESHNYLKNDFLRHLSELSEV